MLEDQNSTILEEEVVNLLELLKRTHIVRTTSEKNDNKKTDDIKSDTSETQTANSEEVKTKVADDVEKKK